MNVRIRIISALLLLGAAAHAAPTLDTPQLVYRTRAGSRCPVLSDTAFGPLLTAWSAPDVSQINAPSIAVFEGSTGWGAKEGSFPVGAMMPGGTTLLPFNFNLNGDAPSQVVLDGTTIVLGPTVHLDTSTMPHVLAPNAPGVLGLTFQGQVVPVPGGYLATAYGHYSGDVRTTLFAFFSTDGFDWSLRSILAPSTIGMPGEGPSETAILRLADGRLFAVFRTTNFVEFAQSWSSDDGVTWSSPKPMPIGMGSVRPRLARLLDGTIVLVAGRPGLNVWTSKDARSWKYPIDLMAHHNATMGNALVIVGDPEPAGAVGGTNSTGYVDVIARPDGTALIVYDRGPYGAGLPIPPSAPDTLDRVNTVWSVVLRTK